MIDFIEIDRPPVIFDNKDFCEGDKVACSFLNGSGCHLFVDGNNFATELLRFPTDHYLKCDECKEAWKKAKEAAEAKEKEYCKKCDDYFTCAEKCQDLKLYGTDDR